MSHASAAPADAPAISLRGLSVAFGHPILRSIDLQIPRGCLYGLIGPGASGKSVLLKCVAGLVRPQAGEVHVLEQDVTRLDELGLSALRQRMGMLFQNNALFDFMTVAENIGFPLRQRGAPDAQIRERTSGIYLRADPADMGTLDEGDPQARVELIARRLAEWKAIANS